MSRWASRLGNHMTFSNASDIGGQTTANGDENGDKYATEDRSPDNASDALKGLEVSDASSKQAFYPVRLASRFTFVYYNRIPMSPSAMTVYSRPARTTRY